MGRVKPSILNGHLFIKKRQENLKTQGRDASYKLKSKLVVIRRNIQLFTGRYYNKQSCWETPYKTVLWRLICLINYLEKIKNATWLSNTYITNTKETFSELLIKAPYVILRFFGDSDYHNCVSVTVDLVLQYYNHGQNIWEKI